MGFNSGFKGLMHYPLSGICNRHPPHTNLHSVPKLLLYWLKCCNSCNPGRVMRISMNLYSGRVNKWPNSMTDIWWWWWYMLCLKLTPDVTVVWEQSCFTFRKSQVQILNYKTEHRELDIYWFFFWVPSGKFQDSTSKWATANSFPLHY